MSLEFNWSPKADAFGPAWLRRQRAIDVRGNLSS